MVAAQTDRPVKKPSGDKVDYQQIPTDPVVFHLGGQPLDEEENSTDPEEKPKFDQQQDSSRPGSPVPPYQQMKISNETNTNKEPTKDPEPVRRPTEQAPTNQPLYHPLKEPSRVNQADSGSPWETAKDNNEERPGQDDQQPDVKPTKKPRQWCSNFLLIKITLDLPGRVLIKIKTTLDHLGRLGQTSRTSFTTRSTARRITA